MREMAKQDSYVSKKLKIVLDAGGLPPEWLAVYIWINELLKIGPSDNIILDGSPRRLMEAKKMDSVLRWINREHAKAFLIDISEEESINRLTKRKICSRCENSVAYSPANKDLTRCEKCGGEFIARADDGISDIKNKFGWYRRNVEKVIRHYKKQGKLVRINGDQPVEQVYKEILVNLND